MQKDVVIGIVGIVVLVLDESFVDDRVDVAFCESQLTCGDSLQQRGGRQSLYLLWIVLIHLDNLKLGRKAFKKSPMVLDGASSPAASIVFL